MTESNGASQTLQAAKLIAQLVPAGALCFFVIGFWMTPGFWTSGSVLGIIAVLFSSVLCACLAGLMIDFFLGLYFLPTLMGASKNTDNLPGIALVNVFFGWSMIGWVIALIWALSSSEVLQNG